MRARRNDFRLELDWVKVLPGGTEADFVLVSCVGVGLTGDARRKLVIAKRCHLSQAHPPPLPPRAMQVPSSSTKLVSFRVQACWSCVHNARRV